MDVELLEIRDFLAGVPPFDVLPPDVLARLPRSLTVRYLRRGKAFPPEGAGPALYVVRQGAVELRNESDELVAKYGEGDVHDATRAPETGPALRGFAVEDTLLYLVPAAEAERLRSVHPRFALHFGHTLREKLRRTVDAVESASTLAGGLMNVDLGSLVARQPVAAPAGTTLQDAARLMSRERVSSLLVLESGRLAGIVTERDLAYRAVAEAISPSLPVREIMDASVQKLPPDAPAFEALLALTRTGARHLAVVEGDRIVGVVTSTDLVRWQSASTVFLVSAVRRAGSIPALQHAAARIPELQIQMIAAGATPRHLGLAMGAVYDALTVRLLESAESELGAPPVPYAWIVCGSQARHEQTVVTDQDNALLLGDGFDEKVHGEWFAALARFVSEALEACGTPLCRGEVMARNPVWRRTRSGWRALFDEWIEKPEPKALMHASLFLDMRALSGDAAAVAAIRSQALQRMRAKDVFVALMARNAIRAAPPLGFFRGLVVERGGEHADTLDLKRGGLLPIVELARMYALTAGSDALGTVERLRAGAEGGAISRSGADDLEHAFGFIAAIRARHQADQLKRGLPPDNHVPPARLSPLERTQLEAAFAVIRSHQDALARVYLAGSLA